jgi:hypothetical protein
VGSGRSSSDITVAVPCRDLNRATRLVIAIGVHTKAADQLTVVVAHTVYKHRISPQAVTSAAPSTFTDPTTTLR